MTDLRPSMAGAAPVRTAGAAQTTTVTPLDNSKAGMGGVDKEAVDKIIFDMSHDGPFYKNEQRKAAQRQRRIDKMLLKDRAFAQLSAAELADVARRVGAVTDALEGCREFGHFVHVDMDMFYAAVEELLDPSLKGKPMAVGGMGMLSTSNYEARKYGVRAGMPGYIARKLCPQLVFAGSGMDKYGEYSAVFKDIAAQFDPGFHSGGMDELGMDVGPYLERANARRQAASDEARLAATRGGAGEGGNETWQASSTADASQELFGTEPSEQRRAGVEGGAAAYEPMTAADVAEEMRAEVFRRTKLTASAGIATVRTLAKICSNFKKPNGQYEMAATTREEVMAFVGAMDVRKIPGIGKATEQMLKAIGVDHCGQIYEQRTRLFYIMTPGLFHFLLSASMGVMSREVEGFGVAKPADTVKAEPGDDEDDGDDDEQRVGSSKPAPLSRKSLGKERTFGGMCSVDQFMQLAERCFDGAHAALVEEDIVARQVCLKLKEKTFEVHSSTRNLARHSNDYDALWAAAEELLAPHMARYAEYRLLGVTFRSLLAAEGLPSDAEDEQPAPPPPVDGGGHPAKAQLTLSQALQRGSGRRRPRDDAVVTISDDDDVVVLPVRRPQQRAPPRLAHGGYDDVIVLSDSPDVVDVDDD
jgi:DNA polymerase kappa